MEISLNNFSYFFQLTGDNGGLSSMEMEFKPHLYKGQDVDDVKAETRRCMDRYLEVLDPLFQDVIEGKKEPQLTDSPDHVSTGYVYRGRFKKKWLRAPEKGLMAIFGEAALEPHSGISQYHEQQVSVLYSFYKDMNRLNDVTVNIKFNVSHILNVCFFRFTQGLEQIRLGQKASANMQQLEETLKIMTERKNVDYYDMMTRSLGNDSS